METAIFNIYHLNLLSLFLNFFYLGGMQPISWNTRVNIAIDVARGLSFLHNLENQVIFRDLKSSNVLLDSVTFVQYLNFILIKQEQT